MGVRLKPKKSDYELWFEANELGVVNVYCGEGALVGVFFEDGQGQLVFESNSNRRTPLLQRNGMNYER